MKAIELSCDYFQDWQKTSTSSDVINMIAEGIACILNEGSRTNLAQKHLKRKAFNLVNNVYAAYDLNILRKQLLVYLLVTVS